ncbi:hypothetical protein [Variovorax boronicumulans]|uniref:hypothetical protein n=1 Tax=Variovorax boronicumulans TaxID=436515 RepID=UPI001C55FA7D
MKGFSWMDVEAATGWLPRSHRALPMRIIIKFAVRRAGHWTYKAAAYSARGGCVQKGFPLVFVLRCSLDSPVLADLTVFETAERNKIPQKRNT